MLSTEENEAAEEVLVAAHGQRGSRKRKPTEDLHLPIGNFSAVELNPRAETIAT